jgi:hypothetical protein
MQAIDSKGRKIGFKRMKVSDQLMLVRLCGDAASNDVYRAFASLIYCAIDIDGEPLPRPTSLEELHANADLLGDEGVNALMKGEAAREQSVDLDAVKN